MRSIRYSILRIAIWAAVSAAGFAFSWLAPDAGMLDSKLAYLIVGATAFMSQWSIIAYRYNTLRVLPRFPAMHSPMFMNREPFHAEADIFILLLCAAFTGIVGGLVFDRSVSIIPVALAAWSLGGFWGMIGIRRRVQRAKAGSKP